MYSFFATQEKKAKSCHNRRWHDVKNPLYQKDAFERDEKFSPRELILGVYPIPYWHLGPDQLPQYQGTLILTFAQFENHGLPHYLIWIDRIEAGDVLYAKEFLDLIFVLDSFKELVELDLRTEMYYQPRWYPLGRSLFS